MDTDKSINKRICRIPKEVTLSPQSRALTLSRTPTCMPQEVFKEEPRARSEAWRHKLAVANLSKGGGMKMKTCPPSLPSPSSSSSSSSSSRASSAPQSPQHTLPRFVPASPSSSCTQPARGTGVRRQDAGEEEDEEREDAGAEATRFLNREVMERAARVRHETLAKRNAAAAAAHERKRLAAEKVEELRALVMSREATRHTFSKQKSELEALSSTYTRALNFENCHIETRSDPTQRGGAQPKAGARRRTRLEAARTTVTRSTLPAICPLPRGQRLPSTSLSETQPRLWTLCPSIPLCCGTWKQRSPLTEHEREGEREREF
jgi:hypothetical protein